MLGGGWRQAGIIASMGIEALKSSWIQRLDMDNQNAKKLAKIIEGESLPVKVQTPQTNIIMIH